MFTRSRLLLGMALALSFILVPTVFAGGWAVITVDELPVTAKAGEPLTIGFTVLQHGRTPVPGLTPTITFTLLKGEQFVVAAEEEGKAGHYTVTVTFPKEGEWDWTIDAFTVPQPMPAIVVSASAAGAPSQSVPQTESIPYLIIVRALAFGLGLLGLIFFVRNKSRAAMAFTILCLAVGLASFIPGTTVPKVEAQDDLPVKAAGEGSISQVEFGRRLFIAKGCITCHANSKAAKSGYWTVEMGAPDLSKFSASPEALRLRLKDPKQVKSDTQMPNLNLSDEEIEALIAFINSE
ncbi:MAG: c-type cytochrome [Chloroflexi bacterium]|nr:c-type cytochrome [Chloroflexota bacterium]